MPRRWDFPGALELAAVPDPAASPGLKWERRLSPLGRRFTDLFLLLVREVVLGS